MPKIKLYNKMYMFHCPACGFLHGFHSKRWKFNGDLDSPTFTPSLMINASTNKCHLNMKDGNINYLNDCLHVMSGVSIVCPEWED